MDGETGSEGGVGKKQPNDPLTTRPQLIASQQAASYYPVILIIKLSNHEAKVKFPWLMGR